MCPGAHATTGPSPPARLCGRSAKCAHGFALVELVIALLLLAFIASSLGLLTITATASYVASEQVTEETTSAVDQIEQLIVLPFDDATLAAGGLDHELCTRLLGGPGRHSQPLSTLANHPGEPAAQTHQGRGRLPRLGNGTRPGSAARNHAVVEAMSIGKVGAQRLHREQTGFSLVEMMLSTAVLVIVLDSAFTMIQMLQFTGSDRADHADSHRAARSAMEWLQRDLLRGRCGHSDAHRTVPGTCSPR